VQATIAIASGAQKVVHMGQRAPQSYQVSDQPGIAVTFLFLPQLDLLLSEILSRLFNGNLAALDGVTTFLSRRFRRLS
jgi:hypothetical protein